MTHRYPRSCREVWPLVLFLTWALGGCQPVAPYQRAKLAHPTMGEGYAEGPGVEHLRAITEGAIGGSTGAGSGCGCN